MEDYEKIMANIKEEKKFMRGDRAYEKLTEISRKMEKIRKELWDFYSEQNPDTYNNPRHPLQLIDKPLVQTQHCIFHELDLLVAERKREGKKPSSWW